jgi:O-succinylbenzoic acid--CoA ligase
MHARGLSIASAAREDPTRAALVTGAQTLSYAELADRAGRCAAWLRARGVRSGDDVRVALVPRLDIESVAMIHAIVGLGVTMVLLHPRLQREEHDALVRDCAPALTIDDARACFDDAKHHPPLVEWPGEPRDEATLAILYTSGTTGRPKGTMLSRRAFRAAARASAANLGWHEDDRWLLCMPLAHVGGLSIVVRCLLARRAVALPSVQAGFDPEGLLADATSSRSTLLSLVPTMLRRMLDSPKTSVLPPSVRVALLGGAAAPASLVEEAAERRLPVLTTYGLTEACSQVTTQRYGTTPGVEQGSGHPVEGMQVRIAADGRIEIRGESMMSGYFPAAAHDDPFLSDGCFRTEDVGRLDEEGRLHVLGRTRELIVTGGENVYPLEVERVLERVDGVHAGCVFGQPDPTWGEIVCAAIVSDRSDIASRVEAHARENLATHKRPRRIALVESLVLGATGKVDRRATAELASRALVPLA